MVCVYLMQLNAAAATAAYGWLDIGDADGR